MLRRIAHTLSSALAIVGVLCIVFIMLAVAASVATRSILGSPISGVEELSEVMMVIIVFLGLGYAQQRGAHVAMTLVVRRIRPRLSALITRSAFIVVLIIIAWMVWVTGERAIESVAEGEYRFGLARVPVWPARIAIVVGLVVYSLEVIVSLIESVQPANPNGASPLGAQGSIQSS